MRTLTQLLEFLFVLGVLVILCLTAYAEWQYKLYLDRQAEQWKENALDLIDTRIDAKIRELDLPASPNIDNAPF